MFEEIDPSISATDQLPTRQQGVQSKTGCTNGISHCFAHPHGEQMLSISLLLLFSITLLVPISLLPIKEHSRSLKRHTVKKVEYFTYFL